MNNEKKGGVALEKILTPQEYCQQFLGINQRFGGNCNELREWLNNNGYSDIWDYPLSEIDEIVKNGLSVVLVDTSYYTTTDDSYKVKIIPNKLAVYKDPKPTSEITTEVKRGQVFTITDERNGFGKLISGTGWISLEDTENVSIVHEYRWFEIYEPSICDTFGQLIDNTYTAEDFTGHLGVLLDKDSNEEDTRSAWEFLEDVYTLATQIICKGGETDESGQNNTNV